MGSRPPRQHTLPKTRHRPHQAAEPEQRGLSMDTITPFIGFAVFPIALIASFIGYAASGSSRTIGTVLVLTVITAVAVWALVRSRPGWRSSARMSNELLMAMLVATIGIALLIGGISAFSPAWIAIGAAIIAGAWFIQRSSSRVAS